MEPGVLELLRLHLQASFGLRVPPLAPGDVDLPASAGAAPWALYAAVLDAAEVRIWRGVPAAERVRLAHLGSQALAHPQQDTGCGTTGCEVVHHRRHPVPSPDRRPGASPRKTATCWRSSSPAKPPTGSTPAAARSSAWWSRAGC